MKSRHYNGPALFECTLAIPIRYIHSGGRGGQVDDMPLLEV